MSADDDFNKILFADSVLDLLAAKVVERLAATGGGQDKAAGVQVKVESGQDWVYVPVFQPMNRSKKSSGSAVKKLRDRFPIREVRPRKLKINQTVFIERIILTTQFSASLAPIDQGRHQGNQRNCTPVLRSSWSY